MTTNKKMTKRDFFNILKKSYPTDMENYNEVIAFIDHEIELLEKKNSAEKKPTAQQSENNGIKEAIVNGMAPQRNYTITDLIKEVPECSELTNQRVSALIRQLIADGKVERFEEKRKAYFRKVGD